MSHQPALQPHVVCLGNPVAGNPTQFVMSRATRECGLDWRFFTSQVREEEFETAVKGVQALGLHGMVLLEPFQTQVIPLLDTVTESARHLNRATIARSDGNSWLGDNLLPAALWHSITSRFPSPEPATAPEPPSLASDSPPARTPSTEKPHESSSEPDLEQVVSPKHSILYVGPTGLGQAMISAKPNTAWECHQWPAPQTHGEESSEELIQAIRSHEFCALLVDEEISGPALRAIQNLNWTSNPLLLKLAPSPNRGKQKSGDLLLARGFTSLEQVEWLSYEACANFTFWTGVVPPIDLIRESLEEYLQW